MYYLDTRQDNYLSNIYYTKIIMSFLPSSVQTFEELGDFKALGSG